MIPFVIIGVAAVFLSGCFNRKAEENPEPHKNPSPEPPPFEVLKKISVPVPPSGPEVEHLIPGPEESSGGKKLSPEELKELGDKLRKIIEVQKNYGLSCPPEEKLPPGVKCEELYEDPRPHLFNPSSPDLFREQIMKSKGPKLQQI